MEKERILGWFKSNMPMLAALFIGLAYIGYGFVTIEQTGKTPLEILADSAVKMVVGYSISKLLSLMGLKQGEQNEKVINTETLHGNKVDLISPYMDKIDAFCDLQNTIERKKAQTRILISAMIPYDDFIKETFKVVDKGVERIVPLEELPKDKQKAIRRAKRLKLTLLTPSDLTTDGGKAYDPFYLGDTKQSHARKKDIKAIGTKVVLAIVFGSFGVSLVLDNSLETLLWNLLQVALFFVLGVISYMQEYDFVVNNYRMRIIRKIDLLDKFMIYAKEKTNADTKL